MQHRPLSPHLEIYKPQLTSVLSILGRFMGAGLFLGFFVLVGWVVALALGAEAHGLFMEILHTWIGIACCTGWTFAFYYYFANGIRHLFWDLGYGYEIKTVYKTGWAVLFASLTLTIGTVYFFFFKELL